jgi:hypothetical protein
MLEKRVRFVTNEDNKQLEQQKVDHETMDKCFKKRTWKIKEVARKYM